MTTSSVAKVPDPTPGFWEGNVKVIKDLGFVKSIKRFRFPKTYQQLMDLRADGHYWQEIVKRLDRQQQKPAKHIMPDY